MFTASQLLTKATKEQIREQIYDFLAANGVATTAWQALSPLRVVIAAVAYVCAVIQNLMVEAIRGGFLSTAIGDWLATTSEETYGVTKVTATFAETTLTCNNAGGGVYAEDPGAIIFRNTRTGKTYKNTAAVNIGSLETGVAVPVIATEIGAASNAAPGEIAELVTGLLGVTCTNAFAAAGQDDEQDAALKQRDLESLAAVSPNGPADAFKFVAKTPSLNGGVTVNRAETLSPPGDGTLTVLIASPSGAVDPADVAKVQLGIDEHCTPEIVTAIVASAVEAAQAFAVTVYVDADSGLTAAEVSALVKPALVRFIDSLPIGGVVVGSDPGKILWRAVVGRVEAAANDPTTGANPGYIVQAKLASEADITLASTAVATLAESSITVSVVFV